MNKKLLSAQVSEWNFDLLKKYEKAIHHAAKKYHLDTYPNLIEVVSAQQMLDVYSATGMPLNYTHWSFGKHLLEFEQQYKKGHLSLAYEVVINSDPCLTYLLEDNTLVMQAIVLAHACYGHNSFFKGNRLIKAWTHPDSFIDYLLFAKNYITRCEQRYGVEAVEETLDACHALMDYGVNRYETPKILSFKAEKEKLKAKEHYLQSQANVLWKTIPEKKAPKEETFINEATENILYFLEKNSPLLEPWQRELIRITRKISHYFFPQKQTKMMNEGWACFWHYQLINDLYDEGLLADDFMLEFLHIHSEVIFQPDFDSPLYTGINPYHLGYTIFKDIKRICENPTAEDRNYFPELIGKNWIDAIQEAMQNFKDSSFIEQYLSPKVIRDLRLFSIVDDDKEKHLIVSAIHNDEGYIRIREKLSEQYHLDAYLPNIQITKIDHTGDRSMTLQHQQKDNRPLDLEKTNATLKHLYFLWKFPIHLESFNTKNELVTEYHYPPRPISENISQNSVSKPASDFFERE